MYWSIVSAGSVGKGSACNAGDLGSILGSGRFLKKEMATHSSNLAWRISWTEEPGKLQLMGSERIRHDCDWTTTKCNKRKESPKRWQMAKAKQPPSLDNKTSLQWTDVLLSFMTDILLFPINLPHIYPLARYLVQHNQQNSTSRYDYVIITYWR